MENDLLQALSDMFMGGEAQAAQIPQPDWNDYATKAQTYLSRPVFQGTPLKGALLAQSAKRAYDETGTVVPLELALAQAQFESGMARKGRNPATNPYNVGEYDEGTKMKFKSIQDGIDAYYKVIAQDYMKDKDLTELMVSFTNKAGNRYASNPEYEKQLKEQIAYINKFLASKKKEK
jgi:hypothetical protein